MKIYQVIKQLGDSTSIEYTFFNEQAAIKKRDELNKGTLKQKVLFKACQNCPFDASTDITGAEDYCERAEMLWCEDYAAYLCENAIVDFDAPQYFIEASSIEDLEELTIYQVHLFEEGCTKVVESYLREEDAKTRLQILTEDMTQRSHGLRLPFKYYYMSSITVKGELQ